MSIAALVITMASLLATPFVEDAATPTYDAPLRELLHEAGLNEGLTLPPGDRDLFLGVLSSDAFLHKAVGPFDLYVYLGTLPTVAPLDHDVEDDPELAEAAAAEAARALAEVHLEAARLLTKASNGMQPLVPVMTRHFARSEGLVAGRRFPIVLVDDPEGGEFAKLVALLDWCEADYSGFVRDNGTLWTDTSRSAMTVRNWEAQIINMGHRDLVDLQDAVLAHGLGYFTLEHLVKRLVTFGGWGDAPAWLAKGIVDELDIEAYGEAWVGHDYYTVESAGYYVDGWSGFLPAGEKPPVPETPIVEVTISDLDDPWGHRKHSATRHWEPLVKDLEADPPASLARTAEMLDFQPRERSFARCASHMLLDVAPPEDESRQLITLLDFDATLQPSGMYDGEPLPVLFAQALGGDAEVDRLEALPTRELLVELMAFFPAPSGSEDSMFPENIAAQLEAAGAGALLSENDHRVQATWLQRRTAEEVDYETRVKIWQLILSTEYWQQQREWQILSARLDEATRAALQTSRKYPAKHRNRVSAAEAFRKALAGD